MDRRIHWCHDLKRLMRAVKGGTHGSQAAFDRCSLKAVFLTRRSRESAASALDGLPGRRGSRLPLSHGRPESGRRRSTIPPLTLRCRWRSPVGESTAYQLRFETGCMRYVTSTLIVMALCSFQYPGHSLNWLSYSSSGHPLPRCGHIGTTRLRKTGESEVCGGIFELAAACFPGCRTVWSRCPGYPGGD